MSLRFRKSINLTKGVKLNLNKNSVSLTSGIKGAHFTVNSKGNTTTSVGIPGSGLSYTKRKNDNKLKITGSHSYFDTYFDEDDLLELDITITELKNKLLKCKTDASMYLISAVILPPLIGPLCTNIILYYGWIPNFVMPILLFIAFLTIAIFKLISANDYKHQLKLYQMHCDKQQEKIIQEEKIADSKLLIPLSPQPSEDTTIKETNTTPKGTILTYELDQYFEEAGRFCIEKKRVSIGLIQRFYKVGFNRAARILDELCDAGVISQEDGTKPRKICMTMEEFEDYLDRLHNYVLTH